MPIFTTTLEEIGSAEVGNGVKVAIQTGGGANNLIVNRRFKVNANEYTSFLYQLLNPAAGYIQDKKYNTSATNPTLSPAYLVDQVVEPLDQANAYLRYVFAMVPTAYDEFNYETENFPGVAISSLYADTDFLFRSAPINRKTQIRRNHTWYLGNPTGIATYDEFEVINSQGLRTSVITDQTTPSADEYISMVNGRQEIVIDSAVRPWMGDIWECVTTFALAK